MLFVRVCVRVTRVSIKKNNLYEILDDLGKSIGIFLFLHADVGSRIPMKEENKNETSKISLIHIYLFICLTWGNDALLPVRANRVSEKRSSFLT